MGPIPSSLAERNTLRSNGGKGTVRPRKVLRLGYSHLQFLHISNVEMDVRNCNNLTKLLVLAVLAKNLQLSG